MSVIEKVIFFFAEAQSYSRTLTANIYHITSNLRSGKLGTINEDDDDVNGI